MNVHMVSVREYNRMAPPRTPKVTAIIQFTYHDLFNRFTIASREMTLIAQFAVNPVNAAAPMRPARR